MSCLRNSNDAVSPFMGEENHLWALFPDTDPGKTPSVGAGDLLISRANTVQLVGAVVLVEKDYPNLLLSDKTLRLVPASNDVSMKYMLYALRTKSVRDVFERKATGTSDSMRNLSQAKIKTAPIPLPPITEQHRIVAEVERRLSVMAELEGALDANLHRAERLRQSILKRAFEGRLALQDPEDEPAGALLERIRAKQATPSN